MLKIRIPLGGRVTGALVWSRESGGDPIAGWNDNNAADTLKFEAKGEELVAGTAAADGIPPLTPSLAQKSLAGEAPALADMVPAPADLAVQVATPSC